MKQGKTDPMAMKHIQQRVEADANTYDTSGRT